MLWILGVGVVSVVIWLVWLGRTSAREASHLVDEMIRMQDRLR